MVKVCSSVQMRGLNAFVGVAAAHIWEMGALPAEPNPPCAVQLMCNHGYSSSEDGARLVGNCIQVHTVRWFGKWLDPSRDKDEIDKNGFALQLNPRKKHSKPLPITQEGRKINNQEKYGKFHTSVGLASIKSQRFLKVIFTRGTHNYIGTHIYKGYP